MTSKRGADHAGPLADTSNLVDKSMQNGAAQILAAGDKAAGKGGHAGGKWNPDEDERLKAVVKELGPKNWKVISKIAFDGSRSDVQCLHRWQKVLRPGLVKGPWLESEDRVIVDLINAHGLGNIKWSEIAASLPGRLGKQCRERWVNHLDPDLRKDPWSEEEDRILIEQQARLGNKWREIAAHLPGRSENSVKNRWNSARRKRKRSEAAMVEAALGEAAPGKKTAKGKRGRQPKKAKRATATTSRARTKAAAAAGPTTSTSSAAASTASSSSFSSSSSLSSDPPDRVAPYAPLASASGTSYSADFRTGGAPPPPPPPPLTSASASGPPLPFSSFGMGTGSDSRLSPPQPGSAEFFGFTPSFGPFPSLPSSLFQSSSSLLGSGLSSLSPPLGADLDFFSGSHYGLSGANSSGNSSGSDPRLGNSGQNVGPGSSSTPSLAPADIPFMLSKTGGSANSTSRPSSARRSLDFLAARSGIVKSENKNSASSGDEPHCETFHQTSSSNRGHQAHSGRTAFSDLQNYAPSFEIVGHALSEQAKSYLHEPSHSKFANLSPADSDATLEVIGMNSVPSGSSSSGSKFGEAFYYDDVVRALQR